MIDYESKMLVNTNGEVTVYTTGEGWREDGKFSQRHSEELVYRVPSVAELKKMVVREKFHTEVGKTAGKCLRWTGFLLTAGSLIFPMPIESKIALGAGGILIGTGGEQLNKQMRDNKSKVDSRVKAFNETFPNQKPITLSFRDYLSTTHIPFRH